MDLKKTLGFSQKLKMHQSEGELTNLTIFNHKSTIIGQYTNYLRHQFHIIKQESKKYQNPQNLKIAI